MLDRLIAPFRRIKSRADVTALLRESQARVHVGCNDVRVPGYVNVDVRSTAATNLVHDCKDLSVFPSESLSFVFSNAFFEHLYALDRLPFLKDLHRALKAGGRVAMTGLPDFEGVARSYLDRSKPGNVSPEFDLEEAYRYTHGAPEGRASWWLAQLHKGLLDSRTLFALLNKAGFASPTVFRYCWGNEPNLVTIGFVAQKGKAPSVLSVADLKQTLDGLPTNINWESLILCSE